jgi:hypothetical protein
MSRGGKSSWKTLRVHGSDRSELGASERLAALYRFQNRETLADVRFVDEAEQATITDPEQIDWATFPVILALEAVTREELQRLHSLFHPDAQLGRAPSTGA